ncbi:Anp1-domain-containing protein [Dichotomocladium elegans]|nr:Anp1-domain-containing protein [Dichotomocladium elegans]
MTPRLICRRLILISTVLTTFVIHLYTTLLEQVPTQLCSSRSFDGQDINHYRDGHGPNNESSVPPVNHTHYYLNLNSLHATPNAPLLVLTPVLRRDREYIERFFDLLGRTTYPAHLISVAFLVTDPNLRQPIEAAIARYYDSKRGWLRPSSTSWSPLSNHRSSFLSSPTSFARIDVYERFYRFERDRAYARSQMARMRNFLLASALRDHHAWVAWVDMDIVDYDPSIFENLMRHDVDVIVPNALLHRPQDNAFWAYDRNNWAETDESLLRQIYMDEDELVMEGNNELSPRRSLMVDMPTHLGIDHRVPLDGTGATFMVVKSNVHREGANFPAFVYKHQLESEAFGKVANALGFSVYGVPGCKIFHAERI